MSAVEVVMYKTETCSDCRVARTVLEEFGIPYREVDVADDDARDTVLQLNGGYCIVPTLVLPSGRVVVEPTAPELQDALIQEGLVRG